MCETHYLFNLLSTELMTLCIECGEWYALDEPKVRRSIARFGHSAVVHDNKMYIFGGFNSIVLDDIFVYEPGQSCNVIVVICMSDLMNFFRYLQPFYCTVQLC